MSEKLRIGIIGIGRWGSNILRTLHAEPDVEIAWTAGTRDWQAKLEKLPHSAQHTDGVTIAVPAPFATTIARMALDYGAPIFLEKPMALDPADARLIRNRAAVMGDLPVLVDHIGLFLAEYEALQAELIGKQISYVETFAGGPGPIRTWGTEHDALWDYGPHEAAFALDLLGVPDSVNGTRAKTPDGDDYHVRLNYASRADNAYANLEFGNCWPTKRRLVYAHAEGTQWKLDALAPFGERLRRNGDPVAVNGAHVPPLTRALRVWLAAVRGDRSDPRLGSALGVKVTELLWRLQEAIARDPAGSP